MIKFLPLLIFIFSNSHAKDMQYMTFQKVVMAQYEMLDVSKQKISETKNSVDEYVNEYKSLWGIEKPIDYKCSNGIETLPKYSSVTPNTTLGKLIHRNCERLMQLEGAKTQIENNIGSVNQMLKDYGVKLKLDSSDNTIVFADKEDRVALNQFDTYHKTKKHLNKTTDNKIVENLSESDKKKLEEIVKDKPVEVVEVKEKKGCGTYDKLCEGLPKWPEKDTVINGITCNDIRRGPNQKWSRRYDFECRKNQVVLLSKPYQWVKRMDCSIKKNAKDKERTKIPEGGVLFTRFTEEDSIGVWSCVDGMGLQVTSMFFNPVKCSDHGKKAGDEWQTYGSVKEHKCKGLCYAGQKVVKKRAVKWDWHCDKFGHIIPGPKRWDSVTTAGINIKRVLIDKKMFRQNEVPEKFVGESCEESARKIVVEERCDLKDKSAVKCPSDFSVAMTKEERDILDDMSFGLPVESCEKRTNFTKGNQCGGKGTNFLQCKKHCRNKCERNKDNEIEESKLELVNYYPDAVRTSSVKKKK